MSTTAEVAVSLPGFILSNVDILQKQVAGLRETPDLGDLVAWLDYIDADCEAKKSIIRLHRQYDWPGCDGQETHGLETCETLRLLAAPFAHVEGYRREWRP